MNSVPHSLHPYLAWLACLHAVHSKVRREGFLAIEMDVHDPTHASSLFSQFPHVLRQPYLDFATDILSLMLSGVTETENLQAYAEQAMTNLTRDRWLRRADAKLLRLIWLMLWSFSRGNAPSVVSEFGRQCLPPRIKPSRNELYDWLREVDHELRQVADTPTQGLENIEDKLDRFMASIGE